MKIDYDKEVDALYIQLLDDPVSETEEISDGIVVDFTADKKVRGLEILNVTKRLDILPGVKELVGTQSKAA